MHDVHHAIVEVNVVIGVLVVHYELLVVRVVPIVACDDAVVRRTLVLIASIVAFVFVVVILRRILLYLRYIVYIFEVSYFYSAASTDYGMSALCKVEHHVHSDFVPLSINFTADMGSEHFLLRSKPWKRPMSSRESSRILCNSVRIRNAIFSVSSFSPINIIVHRDEDDPQSELLRFTLQSNSHDLLNLVENSQCCESCEICTGKIPSVPSRFFDTVHP